MCLDCGIKNKDFAVVNKCGYHCKLYINKINVSELGTLSNEFQATENLATFRTESQPRKTKRKWTDAHNFNHNTSKSKQNKTISSSFVLDGTLFLLKHVLSVFSHDR